MKPREMRQRFAAMGAPSPTGGAAWNPADKSTSAYLSNSNLTLAKGVNTGGDKAARTVTAKATGKWCLPIQIDILTTAGIDLGVATAAATVDGYIGGDSFGWGYDSHNGKLYHGGGLGSSYGATFVAGDVIEVLYDADAGELRFTKNGTVQASGAPAATGLAGAVYGAASINGWNDQVTIQSSISSYASSNGYVLWD